MKRVLYSIFFIFSASIFSTPKSIPVQLPPVVGLDVNNVEHRKIVSTLPGLSVYQDSQDENQYYYIPPFRIFNYKEGSATFVTQVTHLVDLEDAVRFIHEIKNPTNNIPQHYIDMKEEHIKYIVRGNLGVIEVINSMITRYIADVDYEKEWIKKLNEKYFEMVIVGNEKVMNLLREDILKKEKKIEEINLKILEKEIEIQAIRDEEVEKIQQENLRLDEEIARKMRESNTEETRWKLVAAASSLASAGSKFDITKYGRTAEENERMLRDLGDSVTEARNSYAGYMSMNIYAGFTQDEVDAIYDYLQKMPHIKLTLLPAKNFIFEPLTDVSFENGEKQQTLLFRKSTGAGNYTGATLVFDLTLAGAKSLNLALNAFIVPIAIRSIAEMKQTPFEGTLTCDFTSMIDGSAVGHVKDGLVVFDNDISKDISFFDDATSICKMNLKSGSKESAEHTSIKALEQLYESMNMKKVAMATQDAASYHKRILGSAEHMPKNDKKHKNNWVNFYSGDPMVDLAIEAVSQGASFYWHTTKEDLLKLSTLKLKKEFNVCADEKVDVIWPTKICLTFDAYKRAYTRCTEEQAENMKSLSDAQKAANNSEICIGITDSRECGKLRAEEMKKIPEQEIPNIRDNLLI